MNRFREYTIYSESYYKCDGIRLIAKNLITDVESVAYNRPMVRLYRVQTRKRFLGISYWKTLVKTTSYKIAKDAYDLMVWDGKIGF